MGKSLARDRLLEYDIVDVLQRYKAINEIFDAN